ncbi:MAG: Rid family detoxifying hydrolase [Pseudomonadales bacterium]
MKAITTDAAPAAIGTYSQALAHGDTLYISGQIPLDPATGDMLTGNIREQISQVFANLAAIATAAGTDLRHALKLNVYLTDLGNFAAVNEVMADIFKEPLPARAAIQVSALPKGAQVEVDAIVALSN